MYAAIDQARDSLLVLYSNLFNFIYYLMSVRLMCAHLFLLRVCCLVNIHQYINVLFHLIVLTCSLSLVVIQMYSSAQANILHYNLQ